MGMNTLTSLVVLVLAGAARGEPTPAPPPAPGTPAPASPAPTTSTPAGPASAAAPAAKPEAGAGEKGGPSAQSVISDLERQAPPKPAAGLPEPASPPPTATAPVSPPAVSAGTESSRPGKLVREGTFIANRKGRVIRASTGEWVFHFDQNAAAPGEPAMVLMPSLNLAAMEKLAERGGESLTFQVSGQVFVYQGRNYLLPTMYQVNHRAGGAAGAGRP